MLKAYCFARKEMRGTSSFVAASLVKKSRNMTPVVALLLWMMSVSMQAQDIQFSQFYANMLYLNPAFAGSAFQTRAIFHERVQWPSLDAKYMTTSFSLDHNFEKYNSGVGMMVLKDWQGANTISSTEIAFQYAYQVELSSKFALRAGIEPKYVSRYINYHFLTMPDQYSNNGFKNQQTAETFGNESVHFLDWSAGMILYSEHFWLGVASNHLNTPNQSFYAAGSSRLALKLDLTAGYKLYFQRKKYSAFIENDPEISVTPTIHYKAQGKSDQMDVGVYGLYGQMIVGAWYRGIPLLKQYRVGLLNDESVVGLVGWKVHGLSISYSYDFTVSKLVRARTGGSHELNITYVWDYPQNKKKKPMKRLPCPDFFK